MAQAVVIQYRAFLDANMWMGFGYSMDGATEVCDQSRRYLLGSSAKLLEPRSVCTRIAGRYSERVQNGLHEPSAGCTRSAERLAAVQAMMIGSDVVIAGMVGDQCFAYSYYLTAKEQCNYEGLQV